MLENQLSRYGAISRVVPGLAPGAKLFLVADSDDTTVGAANLANEFPPDKEGVVRVYTTVQSAVNAASAGRGDVVLVAPGYDQTLSRTDSWATAGVQVIGLGYGSQKPTLRYGTKTDQVKIGASNVRVSGMRFLADADSIAIGVSIDSGFTGVQFDHNEWDFDSNTSDFRVMLKVKSRRSVIENNRFIAEDTAGAGRAISLVGGDASYSTIRGNFFYGQFDTVGDTTNGAGVIAVDTTDITDVNISGMSIEDNTIVSTDTAAAMLMRLSGGGTVERGIANNNRFATYDTVTADTAQIAFGGILPIQNYVKTADSDIVEGIVGQFSKRGVIDS